MRISVIFLAATLISAGLALGSFMLKDPLPLLIIAVLTWPLWMFVLMMATLKPRGSVDYLQLRNYSNVEQIRHNTDRIGR